MAGTKKGRASTNNKAEPRKWERSPDPQETWDSDQEWEVGDIVDMYVDPMVPDATMYKVSWPGWEREDGSNTTWMHERECNAEFPNILKAWKTKHARGTAKMSKPRFEHSLFHLDVEEVVYGIKHSPASTANTSSRQNTGPVPARSSRVEAIHPKSEDDELDILARPLPVIYKHTDAPKAPTATNSKRRHSPSPLPASSSRTTRRSTSSTLTATDSRDVKRRHLPSLTIDPRSPISDIASPSSSRTLVDRSPRPTLSKGTGAVSIIREWEAAIGDAAMLTFLDNTGDKFLRDLPKGFKYLESKYLNEKDIAQKLNFFAACSCSRERCSKPERCDCQADSTLFNARQEKIIAYDPQRRYQFPTPGTLVLECNEACTCDDETCANRVAQRPRDVPLQIFMTRRCGWGVKTTDRLVRGQFIGLYTGQLMRREQANDLREPQRHYVFDLDFDEPDHDDYADRTEKFSVVSYSCGNWSRFLNHSCDPNVRIYPVLFDDPQIPKLAFVAAKDLDPFTELVIDYMDAAGIRANSGKRVRKPENAAPCACGAGPNKCRGWYSG